MQPHSDRRAPRPLARAAFALAVALAAALPFARAIGQPFIAWDDDINFLLNPHFRGLGGAELRWMWSSFHVGHYMPVTWMTCALDYVVFGLDAAAFHATSIAWHAATTLLVYAGLVELLELAQARASALQLRVSAALGALFFGMHPLRVESVAWATERRDVVSGAFLALALWLWLRAQRPAALRSRLLALSIASFAASLLAKVSGMALPFVLLALDAWPLRRQERAGWRPLLLEKLPYLALALGGAALGYFGQRESTQVLASLDALPLGERLAVSAYALRFYLRKTLLPLGLAPLYELPLDIDPLARPYLPALAFAVLATGFLFVVRRRSATLASAWTAWLVFALLVAPVIGLVHAGRQIAADRYTYLPSFACAAALAALCLRARYVRLAAPVALLALGLASWHQTGFWRDTQSVFERVVEIAPESYWGHHKLGILAHQRGAEAEALRHYAAALATRPERGNADAHYDRAVSYFALGRRVEALADAQAALRDDPFHAGALRMRADELLAAGQRDEACASIRDALARAGERPDLYLALAGICLGAERSAEALAAAARAAALEPDSALAFRLQGTAALYLGRFSEAEAHLRRALALGASDAELHYQLGVAVARQGREADARALWRRVLELDPAHEAARRKLEGPSGQ